MVSAKYNLNLKLGKNTQVFKNVEVNFINQPLIFSEYSKEIKQSDISWDSKLKLNFNFSKEILEPKYNFNFLRSHNFVVIRNRFNYLPRDQIKINQVVGDD